MKKFLKKLYHVENRENKRIVKILGFKFKRKFKNGLVIPFTPNVVNCGRCSYSAPNLKVANRESTYIGSFVSIGSNVQLGNGEHPLNYLSTSPYFYVDELGFKLKEMPTHAEFSGCGNIYIGNDVWIGDNVLVMNGVKIGDGAVVGAGAVVTKDVPPYAIVGGVPAKVIRYRFDEETIAELLDSKWWQWEDDEIRKIPFDDITATLGYLKRIRIIINVPQESKSDRKETQRC